VLVAALFSSPGMKNGSVSSSSSLQAQEVTLIDYEEVERFQTITSTSVTQVSSYHSLERGSKTCTSSSSNEVHAHLTTDQVRETFAKGPRSASKDSTSSSEHRSSTGSGIFNNLEDNLSEQNTSQQLSVADDGTSQHRLSGDWSAGEEQSKDSVMTDSSEPITEEQSKPVETKDNAECDNSQHVTTTLKDNNENDEPMNIDETTESNTTSDQQESNDSPRVETQTSETSSSSTIKHSSSTEEEDEEQFVDAQTDDMDVAEDSDSAAAVNNNKDAENADNLDSVSCDTTESSDSSSTAITATI
jgi:hypothetical protein